MINQMHSPLALWKQSVSVLPAILLLSVFAAPAFANEKTDQTVQAFFTQLGKNNIEEAAEVIVGTADTSNVEDLPEQLDKLKASFAALSTAAGVYAGNEKIAEKAIGANFVHVQYLGYFTQEPIHFKFSFYRYKKVWRVLNFSFDYDFAERVKNLLDQQLTSTNSN